MPQEACIILCQINVLKINQLRCTYARSKKFCQRTTLLISFFLLDEGREDPNTTISGRISERQRNTIFEWRFAGVPMIA